MQAQQALRPAVRRDAMHGQQLLARLPPLALLQRRGGGGGGAVAWPLCCRAAAAAAAAAGGGLHGGGGGGGAGGSAVSSSSISSSSSRRAVASLAEPVLGDDAQASTSSSLPASAASTEQQASAAASSSSAAAAAPFKPLFSSRVKYADGCLPWLKQARNRTNLEKNFALEQLYDCEVSSVHVATSRAHPAQRVIVKAFRRAALEARPDLQHKVRQEWDVHAALAGHPNIVTPYLGMEDGDGVKLLMEFAGETDAYSYISAKRRLSLREDDARELVFDVLTALQHMHALGIVHRDVKSENVFRTACGAWKLGDFGSCLRIGDARALAKQVVKLEGTFSFAAPEYVRIWRQFTRPELLQATSFKLDSWSAGALAYDVLCGHAPFAPHEGVPRDEEAKAILEQEPRYPSGLSYDAVGFIMQALEKTRQKRPTVAQLLVHPWFDPLRRRRQKTLNHQRRQRQSSGGGGGGGSSDAAGTGGGGRSSSSSSSSGSPGTAT